jgi:hypothetical protein
MAIPFTLSEPALRALAWLLDLAAQRAGFTVLGKPGWASADDIESGVRGWGTHEMMRAQAKRGRVLQYDARAPGELRPRWLYRISQKGIDDLGRALGITSPAVSEPEARREPRIFLRDTTQHAISGLRAALDSTAKARREWVKGEVGWRSSRELTAEMAREDEAAGRPHYRWFNSEDMRWLVRLGFVEERVVGKSHVYRLLPAGAELRALEWRDPKDGG